MASAVSSNFTVAVSFQGQSHSIEGTTSSTVAQVFASVLEVCNLEDEDSSFVKILYKGKKLNAHDNETILFPKRPNKPKLMVMSSGRTVVKAIQEKKSDPTIRGFDQERARFDQQQIANNNSVWGSVGGQDKNYRFVKIKACNDQDFGLPGGEHSNIPHTFAAQQLLEKMANDPGVVAIMKERKLVVNTLEELDPIEDRLMQKKQHGGSALLGYNTNRGLSIHVRLRAFDLNKGFLPYPQLVSTLIHELSHNWVGDHDLLFWGNFAQMRVEYLHTHARLQGTLIQGKTTAALAEITQQCRNGMAGIAEAVVQELAAELPQYGLTPQPLAPAIVDRCRELTQQYSGGMDGAVVSGQRLGGSSSDHRQAALEAAERRRQDAINRRNPSNQSHDPNGNSTP